MLLRKYILGDTVFLCICVYTQIFKNTFLYQHTAVFCVITGFSCSDSNTASQIVLTKDGFFFLIILLERDRRGRIDFKWQWEEELQWDAHPLVGLMSFHMQTLSNEPEWMKHNVTSKFQRPSADFTPFWSYIQNLDKGNPSLPEYHATRYSEQLLTILAQPLHSVTSN